MIALPVRSKKKERDFLFCSLYSDSFQLFNTFRHTYTILHIFILAVIWNVAVPGFVVQTDRLRLFISCF